MNFMPKLLEKWKEYQKKKKNKWPVVGYPNSPPGRARELATILLIYHIDRSAFHGIHFFTEKIIESQKKRKFSFRIYKS